jgi:hypothetical protein
MFSCCLPKANSVLTSIPPNPGVVHIVGNATRCASATRCAGTRCAPSADVGNMTRCLDTRGPPGAKADVGNTTRCLDTRGAPGAKADAGNMTRCLDTRGAPPVDVKAGLTSINEDKGGVQ